MKYSLSYITKKLFSVSAKNYIRYAKICRSKIQYIFCDFLKGYASIPPIFYLLVTNRCNYKCVMCDFNRGRGGYFRDNSGEEIPLADWRKLIDSISIYRPAIFFPAPEPFLYKDIMPLISHIKSHQLFCSIATNGSLLNKYAKQLVDMGIDALELSCDGPLEVHDKIRGVPGAFLNLIDTMVNIQKMKGKSKEPRLTVTFTITHLNYHRVEETLDILDKLGVEMDLTLSHLSYMPAELVIEHNKRNELIKIQAHTKECEDICKNIDINILSRQLSSAKKKKYKNINNLMISPDLDSKRLYDWYNSPANLNMKSYCFFPWLTALINFNGNIILSPVCGPVFGNITQQSFISLWNTQKFRDVRMRIFKDKKYPACFGCCSVRTF